MPQPAQIICPRCKKALDLPAQLEVMREVHRSGGSYIALGDPNRRIACPSCGESLRVGDVIEGKHDPQSPGCFGELAELAGIAVGIALIVGVIILVRAYVFR